MTKKDIKKKTNKQNIKVPFWLHILGFILYLIILFLVNIIEGVSIMIGGLIIWFLMFKIASDGFKSAKKEGKNPYIRYFLTETIFLVGLTVLILSYSLIFLGNNSIETVEFKTLKNDINNFDYNGFLIYDDEILTIKYPPYLIPEEPIQDFVYKVFRHKEEDGFRENFLIIFSLTEGYNLEEINNIIVEDLKNSSVRIIEETNETMYGKKAISKIYELEYNNQNSINIHKVTDFSFIVDDILVILQYTNTPDNFDLYIDDFKKTIKSLELKPQTEFDEIKLEPIKLQLKPLEINENSCIEYCQQYENAYTYMIYEYDDVNKGFPCECYDVEDNIITITYIDILKS